MALNKTIIVNPQSRIQMLRIFILICLGVLCIRLWFLQVLNGSYYRDKSENNRIRTVKVVAPRGRIIDRNESILVRNRPSFNVGIMVEDVEDPAKSIANVAKASGIEPGILFDNYTKNKSARRFEPRIIMEDISVEQFTKLKANSYSLPGISFDSQPTRAYPYFKVASQLFGYVREITKQQLDDINDVDYKIGDVIGQTGLEKFYEEILRGRSGYLQLEVDAKGIKKQELDRIPAKPGRDIKLSIDIDLQEAAEKAMGDHRGAVIALDPNNGEILVLSSLPTFDANFFSGELLAKEWDVLTKDPSKPMINRAISHAYPLGSTSKLLWSIAGISENIINPNSTVYCPGYFRLGNRRYLCNKPSGHGTLDLRMALTVSCNAYYYTLGQNLGIDKMAKYLKIFGFGEKTGIDLLGEEVGTAPSPEWKLKRFKEKWYPGDSVPISIGQGYFIATPIQLAQLGMTISNLGKMYKPHLMTAYGEKINGNFDNVIVPELKRDLIKDYGIKEDVIRTIREISASVVENDRGTAKAARIPGIRVGGKTGTAQVVKKGLEHSGAQRKDHAWFVGYAPIENPTIVVVALVENSGHGGEFAAPVVREVMYKYFDKKGMIDHTKEIQKDKKSIQQKINSNANLPQEESENDNVNEVVDSPQEESEIETHDLDLEDGEQ